MAFRRQMHRNVGVVRCEYPLHRVSVADISDFQRIGLVARVWDVGLVGGVSEAIDIHHLMPFGEGMAHHGGPDKTAAPCHQQFHDAAS